MSRPIPKKRRRIKKLLQRKDKLTRAANNMDLVASGTPSMRTKVCGRPNCRCARDVTARHGPYYEWSRRSDGRLVHHILTDSQAEDVRRAIANRREFDKLLSAWEAATIEEILDPDENGGRA